MEREPLVEQAPARKKNSMMPNFDPDEPDCMTLVLMGEHIDPKELAELSDQGYASLLVLTSGAGALANLILSVVKIFAGHVYHSKALFADGIHSFSDLVSDVAAGYAGHMSGKKADANMPYGYGKWEAMGTLMVGLMLLAAAGSLIVHLVEHLREVFGSGNVQYVEIAAMFVAVVSTIVKEVAFQATFRVGTKINSQVLIANAWHHRSDALSSIVALVGVIGARWGLTWADAVAGVCVSLLLLKVGAETLLEATGSLVDKAVTEDVQEAVESCVTALGERESFQGTLTQLRARQTGRKRALDVTLAFPADLALASAAEQAELMRRAVRKEVPNTGEVLVQLQTTAQAAVMAQAARPTAPPVQQHEANPNKVKAGATSFHMV